MIKTKDIIEKLSSGIDNALKVVDEDVTALLSKKLASETSAPSKWALSQILENNSVSKCTNSYACQDTGVAMLFVSLGQNAKIDGDLADALNEGVKRGYANARKSIAHPLTRLNTEDNTPAVIYYDITHGDGLEINYLAKGAGSENMGGVSMLTPSKGRQGIIDAVTAIVKKAGANPCPPIIVGVGIGGTMDKASVISKQALTRKLGTPHPDSDVARLESEILESVNALGIGVQGLGGNCTALSVQAEVAPTHIGMLPVAVTIQCHSARHCHIKL